MLPGEDNSPCDIQGPWEPLSVDIGHPVLRKAVKQKFNCGTRLTRCRFSWERSQVIKHHTRGVVTPILGGLTFFSHMDTLFITLTCSMSPPLNYNPIAHSSSLPPSAWWIIEVWIVEYADYQRCHGPAETPPTPPLYLHLPDGSWRSRSWNMTTTNSSYTLSYSLCCYCVLICV